MHQRIAPFLLIFALGCGFSESFAGTVRVPYATSGTYSAAALSGNTISFDIGTWAVNMTALKTFTYTNKSASPITITNIQTSDNVYLYNGDCSSLAPNQSCEITLAMHIDVEGVNSGWTKFYVTDMAAGTTAVDTFELSGTGVASSSVLQVSPSSGTFTYSSEIQEFVVTNTQTFPVKIDSLSIGNSAWKVISSTCTTAPLAPNATCAVSLQYNASRASVLTSSLKFMVDSVPFASLPVSGSLVYGAPSFDIDQLSFKNSFVNVAKVRTVTVTNKGLGKLFVNNVVVSGGDGVYSVVNNSCSAKTLAPNQSCSVDVRALFSTANKFSQAALSFSYSNTVAGSSAIAVDGDSASVDKELLVTPSPVSFGTNLSGNTNTIVVTATAGANSAVNVSDIVITGGQNTAFTLNNKANCVKTLAAASSCTVSLSVAASAEGVYATTLQFKSDAATVSVPVSATIAATSLVPNPATISFTGTTASAYSQVVQLTNTSAFVTTVSSITASTPSLTISSNTCTTLNPGQSCAITVSLSNVRVVKDTQSVGIQYSSGLLTKSLSIPVAESITSAGLAMDAFNCPVTAVSVSGVCTAKLNNLGSETISVTSLSRTGTTFGAPVFDSSAVFPVSIAPKSFVTISVPFKIAAAGAYTTTVTAKTAAASYSQPASVTITAPNPAIGSLSAFSCGSAVLGAPVTCTAVLTNTSSSQALPVSAITSSNPGFTLAHKCPVSLSASKTCDISVTVTPSTLAEYSTTVTANTNPIQSQKATVQLTGTFSISVTSPAPVTVLAGSTTGANLTSTFTNTGNVSVNLGSASKSVVGGKHTFVSSTCSGVLAPSASCVIVSKFTSPVEIVGSKGSAILTVAGSSFSANLEGSAKSDKLTVVRKPGITSYVGFRSFSGNEYVVTNVGVSNAVISSLGAVSGTTLQGVSTGLTCAAGVTLSAGQSCGFLETVSTTTRPATSAVISGSGTIKTKTASVSGSWPVAYTMVPPVMALTEVPPVVALEDSFTTYLKVTNPGHALLSNIQVETTSTVGTTSAVANTSGCATLSPGASCNIPVTFSATTAKGATISFNLKGTFATERNGSVVASAGENVIQAVLPVSITFSPAAGSFNIGTYPPTKRAESTQAAHKFNNTGTSVINIATLTLTEGPGQSILTDTCSNISLKPGQSCTFSTTFYSDLNTQEYAPAKATIKTVAGKEFSAYIAANPLGELEIDYAGTYCNNQFWYPSQTEKTLTINENEVIRCRVGIKNAGAGSLKLATAGIRMQELKDFAQTPRFGFVPFSATQDTAYGPKAYIIDQTAGIGTDTHPGFKYINPVTAPVYYWPGVSTWTQYTNPNFKALLKHGWFDLNLPWPVSTQLLYSSTFTKLPGYYYHMAPWPEFEGYTPYSQFFRFESANKARLADYAYDYDVLQLYPGAKAYFMVTLQKCSTLDTVKPVCYSGVGQKKIEMVIRASSDTSSSMVAGPFVPIAKFDLIANVKRPSIGVATSAQPGTTNLTAGQSVTFTYTNNDYQKIPFGLPQAYAVSSVDYSTSTASITRLKENKEFLNLTIYGWLNITNKSNAINGQTELILSNRTTGFITASTCAAFGTLDVGQSCYVRQSCLLDPVSGTDIRGTTSYEAVWRSFKDRSPVNSNAFGYLFENERAFYADGTNKFMGPAPFSGDPTYMIPNGYSWFSSYTQSPLNYSPTQIPYTLRCEVPVNKVAIPN